MKRLTIERRLWGGFILAILVLAGVGAVGMRNTRQLQAALREVARERWTRVRDGHGAALLINANLQSRLTLFLTSDSATTARLLREQAEQSRQITARYTAIQAALSDSTERTLFAAIVAQRVVYLDRFNVAKAQLVAGHRDAAAALVMQRVLPEASRYLVAWEAFVSYEGQRVDAAAAGAETAATRATAWTVVTIIGALTLVLLTAWTVVRATVTPLRALEAAAGAIAAGDLGVGIVHSSDDELGSLASTMRTMAGALRSVLRHIDEEAGSLVTTASALAASAQQVTASSEEIASSAQELSSASGTQLAAIQSVTAAADDASIQARQLKEQASLINDAVERVSGAATTGATAAEAALASTTTITAATADASPLVRTLKHQAGEIREFTAVIEDIVRQIDLLAINAAIEAARAGDHGRGFGVVTDELRTLSIRSTERLDAIRGAVTAIERAIAATGARVAAIESSVATGDGVIREAASQLAAIAVRVREIRLPVEQIVTLSATQHDRAGALADEVKTVTGVAERNASVSETLSAASEEQAASMQHVGDASDSLARVAERLKALTGGFTFGAEDAPGIPAEPSTMHTSGRSLAAL